MNFTALWIMTWVVLPLLKRGSHDLYIKWKKELEREKNRVAAAVNRRRHGC